LEAVSIVLFLLLAVVLSGSISRMLPVPVPTPLVQIMLGAVIGLSTSYRVALDPELFLLLFLPPLLFLDGWRIPKDELLKDISTVVELALGLVLITVIGMGLFIHWMIPAMPLAVAFALAAVVSPTDPIAVSAIAARVPIPKRMMHIRRGIAAERRVGPSLSALRDRRGADRILLAVLRRDQLRLGCRRRHRGGCRPDACGHARQSMGIAAVR